MWHVMNGQTRYEEQSGSIHFQWSSGSDRMFYFDPAHKIILGTWRHHENVSMRRVFLNGVCWATEYHSSIPDSVWQCWLEVNSGAPMHGIVVVPIVD